MSNTRDDSTDDDEQALVFWETQRQRALRTFQVTVEDAAGARSVVTVFAHYHENTNPAGHLNFMTVQPSGRTAISNCFQRDEWRYLTEVSDAESDAAMAHVMGTPDPTHVAMPKKVM